MTAGPRPTLRRSHPHATELWSVSARFTCREEGDMGHGGVYVEEVRPDVEARRRAVVDLPWTWLRQVHGHRVVRVTEPGEWSGTRADAAVTAVGGCAVAVFSADCAPVVLGSPEGVAGVAHAGWRGLLAGVLERTVEEMRVLGATTVGAVLGPCIRASCYEFGPRDLDAVAARLGDTVRAATAAGAPALDVAAGVRAALAGVGVDDVDDVEVCTACSPEHFSWRARREQQLQATVAWLGAP